MVRKESMFSYEEALKFLHEKSLIVRGWKKRFETKLVLVEGEPYVLLFPPSDDAICGKVVRAQELGRLNQELAENGFALQFVTCECAIQRGAIGLFVQKAS